MKLLSRFKAPLMDGIDTSMALWPNPTPNAARLKAARIVAHRGLVSAQSPENTLKAFEDAARAGIWAVEFDIRWTQCQHPVIHHDPNCRRIFKNPSVIAKTSFKELRSAVPDLASFDEVLERIGKTTHMMIEIKDPVDTISETKLNSLKSRLKNLEPVRDYHIMSLDTRIFKKLDFVPTEAWLPIAEFKVSEFSDFALRHHTAGLTGYYLFLGPQTIQRHHEAKQIIGTGFVNSPSILFRELNRNVDWIFSDTAKELQETLKSELAKL